VHREQDTAVHRFEAIANVGERSSHDYAHCVIEVGMPHFCFEAYGQGFFGELLHCGPALYRLKWLQLTRRKSPRREAEIRPRNDVGHGATGHSGKQRILA
jgi:hypothetical protein